MNALKAVPCFLEIQGFMYETHMRVQLKSNKISITPPFEKCLSL